MPISLRKPTTPDEILWREGPFCCQFHATADPPYLSVDRNGHPVLELTIESNLAARERAADLQALVRRLRDRDLH